MLTIDKSESGMVISMEGNAPSILAELGILVEAVQEQLKGKADVRSALNDPIQKCLSRAYLKAMRENKQPNERRQNGK